MSLKLTFSKFRATLDYFKYVVGGCWETFS